MRPREECARCGEQICCRRRCAHGRMTWPTVVALDGVTPLTTGVVRGESRQACVVRLAPAPGSL
jgi:hypothetical protein